MNISPLRYPGGKSKFVPVIKQILEQNNCFGHFVEPYAGGSSVALAMLFEGCCTDIHLNDLDAGIYSFWKSVIEDTDNLIRLIQDTPITLEEWNKQKAILFNANSPSVLELGFATFFLNRTNRSGILKAGIIGGKEQSGKYKLSDRFNKSDLIQRIEKIAEKSSQIHLYHENAEDWILTLDQFVPSSSLVYADPPYYVQGSSLYREFYRPENHRRLKSSLDALKLPWLLSYDNVDEIKELYCDYQQKEVSFSYSVHRSVKATELLIGGHNILFGD